MIFEKCFHTYLKASDKTISKAITNAQFVNIKCAVKNEVTKYDQNDFDVRKKKKLQLF